MSKLKVILKLAMPIVVNLLLLTTIQFTDLYVVSKFGVDAVTGVGIVQSVWGILFSLTIIFSSGGQVLLTRYVGQKSYKKASLVISSLLIVALATSLLFIAIFAVMPKMILWFMGVDGKVMEYTLEFGYILLLDIPFILINVVIDTALHSYGNSKTPMYLAMVAAVLNVILDFGLGLGYFGMPNMGVFGVALSTVISYGVISALHLYIYFAKKMPYIPTLRFRKNIFKRAFKVALPEVASRGINTISNLIFTTAVISLGSSYYAGFNITMKIMAIGYMPIIAFAVAGGILIGQKIGEKNYEDAKGFIKIIAGINLSIMLITAIFFIIYADNLATIFSADKDVIKIIVESIIFFAISDIPFAIDATYTFALNGAGLTKKTFKINMITLWIFRIAPALYGIYVLGSYEWVLGVFLIQFSVTAYLMYREFQKDEWMKVKV